MSTSIPAPPNLMSPEHMADPWQDLAILRDHYPVHFDETMECWLVSRYDDIRAVNRVCPPGELPQEMVGQYFADEAVTFMAMEGPEHRKRRALIAPWFSRSAIDGGFRAVIERRAHALLDPIFERERKAVAAGERERGEMDWSVEFAQRLAIDVMIDMLGLPTEDFDRIKQWILAWMAADLNITLDPEVSARAAWARDDSAEYLKSIIAERRANPGEDFISYLCHAELDGAPVPDDEIRSIAALCVLGGGDSTGKQLGWIMHELIRHPDQQQAFVEDRSLMPNLLAETMRYASIVAYLPAVPPEDITVGDVTLEKGATVALVLPAGNHDPSRFSNPDEFNIFRDDLDASKAFTGAADHLGFGGGSHFCPGTHLTKAEQESAINIFFDNARDVRFAEGFEPQVDLENPYLRSFTSMKISFELV